MPPKDWTKPCDIRARLLARWNRGKYFSDYLDGNRGTVVEPLKYPSANDRGDHIVDFMKWKDSLIAESQNNFEIEFENRNDKVFGAVTYPRRVVFASLEAVVDYIGKANDFSLFKELSARLVQFDGRLAEWVAKRPLKVLENKDKWDGILSFVGWMREHPNPGIYLREVPAEGVHTKFVENENIEIIKSILDIVLPQDAIHQDKSDIVERYGFKKVIPVQSYIAFRMLDDNCPFVKGVQRQFFAMPACDLATMELDIDTVFIVENHVTYESFPKFHRAMCINGQGKKGQGLAILGLIGWLSKKRLVYAGDLDQSGFSILSHVRGLFPHVESMLMDEDTLMRNRPLWGQDTLDKSASFENLTEQEENVRKYLCSNGNNIRLEQERIPQIQLEQALSYIRKQC